MTLRRPLVGAAAGLAVWALAAVPCQAAGPAPADPVHLPMLGGDGAAGGCEAWVHVQNLGPEASKAALLIWGTATACPGVGDCAAPRELFCSGLMAPGTSWAFGGPAFAADATSGVVYSFTPRRLSEIGAPISPDRPVADYLCGLLYSAVRGSCDNYLRFKEAYESGATFGGGVRLALAYGGALAVSVQRRCPTARLKLPAAAASYEGIAGQGFGGRERIFPWSSYYAAGLVEDPASGQHAVVYLQNGGLHCASVEVWVMDAGTCGRARLRATLMLAPGSSRAIRSDEMLRPGARATGWLRSSEPLAVAVDLIGPEERASHVAVPAELQPAIHQPPVFTAGSTAVFGPLPPGTDSRRPTEIHVQNLSSELIGEVELTFLDAAGIVTAPLLTAKLCPRGTHVFDLPEWFETSMPPAAVRVVSVPTHSSGGETLPAANVSVMVVQRRQANGDGVLASQGPASAADAWAGYNLPADPAAGDWRFGRGLPGAERVALPQLAREATGSSRLAVTNTVPQAGTTHAALLVYDANGLVAARCLVLPALSTVAADLTSLGLPGTAFRGSGVVSAMAWRHPVFDARGRESANLVGLAALAVTERSAGAGGDEVGASVGIPFGLDGPGNPFAANRPPCPPMAVVGDPGRWRRAFLPVVAQVRGGR